MSNQLPTQTDNSNEAQPTASPPPISAELQVDMSRAASCYANFCRVTGTPEEIVFDLGLNTQTMGPPSQPIVIDQRLIMNYYTAKRMMAALGQALQRHEAVFGALEIDVMKRARPTLRTPSK